MPENTGDDDGREDDTPPAEAELAAAVDDAMDDELRRQKARFVQQILGMDRREGTGRRDERWGDEFDRRHGPEDPE